MSLKELLFKVLGSGAGFFLAALAAFTANVVLSNMLDADAYGSVALMLTCAMIATQFTQLGFLRASTKIISVARADQNPPVVRAFLTFALPTILVSGIIGAALVAFGIRTWVPSQQTLWSLAIPTGLLLLPLSLCRVGAGVMLGEGRGFAGAFFQTGLPYLGILAGAGVLAARHPGLALDDVVPGIMGGAFVAGIAAIAAMILITRDAWLGPRASITPGPWMALALPLMLAGATQIVNRQIGTVIVGALEGAEAVSAYFPALRISEFATFGLIAVNAVAAARLSAAYRNSDHAALQSTLTRAAVLTLASTILLVAVILSVGGHLLGWFGGLADQGALALQILLIGQIANAATGSAGVLMTMVGQERFAAAMALAILFVNVALHLALVPVFGIEGAAVATTISAVLWNLSLIRRSLRVLRVNPTVFTRELPRLLR